MNKIILIFLLLSTSLLAKDFTIATGYGNTENEALKSAYQNAVEQYVGVLVDSKTVIKNSQLIQNKILTFSNGYIDSYKKLSSKEQIGLWEVRIKAVIKKQEVLSKVKSLKIEPKNIQNAPNLHAKILTQVKSKFDAEDMLIKYVQDISKKEVFYRYINLKIDSFEINIDEATRTEVPVNIKYSIVVNLQEYSKIIKSFEKLFKAVGGEIVESNSIEAQRDSWIRLRSDEDNYNAIPIVILQNNKLVVNFWKFPKSYNNIYPLSHCRSNCSSPWSILNKDLDMVYNSTYKNIRAKNRNNINCYHNNLKVQSPHIFLSILDKNNETIFKSKKISSAMRYDEIFKAWDMKSGTTSPVGKDIHKHERMLNALKIYNIDRNRRKQGDYLTLEEKVVHLKLPIKVIKDLKQVKIAWDR